MKATIFSHENCIGYADLYLGDESMGGLTGTFIPTDNYYKYVQKVVWEFWHKRQPDHAKWASLKINVQLDNGYFLFAAGGFTFSDLPELQNEPKTIDIAGVDRHVIEDYFLEPTPRPFVEEPWGSISIGQKLTFENELKKELGVTNSDSFFSFFKAQKRDHVSSDNESFALCHDIRNDDVLFRISNKKNSQQFAVVHLTWTGVKEFGNYPLTKFYETFDEFKFRKMYPDKVDWEY